MSFWRKDLLAINGYNESIEGWGAEDAEIATRLINAGVRKRFLKFSGIVFHIYHKENSRANAQQNKKILDEAVQSKKKWIPNGIIKENSYEE